MSMQIAFVINVIYDFEKMHVEPHQEALSWELFFGHTITGAYNDQQPNIYLRAEARTNYDTVDV